MLTRCKRTAGYLLMAATVGGLGMPATAFAHSDEAPGEHAKAFREHIGDYEADVAKLVDQLGNLADRYADGDDVAKQLDAFVEAWEHADYHETLERKAVPMYGPVWQHVSALEQAIEGDKPAEVVRKRTEQTAVALHEGMGAIKLRASMQPETQTASGETREDAGPEATLHAINEALEHAVAEYTEGEAKEAKELIQSAYFNRFEGIEGGLIEKDPKLVTDLEKDFNAVLPGLINEEAPVEAVREQVEAMNEKLARAGEILAEAEGEKSEVF